MKMNLRDIMRVELESYRKADELLPSMCAMLYKGHAYMMVYAIRKSQHIMAFAPFMIRTAIQFLLFPEWQTERTILRKEMIDTVYNSLK